MIHPAPPPTLLVLTGYEFDQAKKFVFGKWCERASERGEIAPLDLSRSCKYGSLFMYMVFGGEIQGNYQHQYNFIEGQIIDLSHDAADVIAMREPYHHEAELFGIDEHVASMQTCHPRVEGWVADFMLLDRWI
jgi:hypothetical protein